MSDNQYKTFSSVARGYEPFILGQIARNTKKDVIYVAPDGVELANMAALTEYIFPDLKVLKFPAWDTVPYDRVSPSSTIVSERVSCLSELAQNQNAATPRIIITSVGAVLQKLPPRKIFLNSMREIKVGGKLNFNDFLHYAAVNGYTRVEQVFEAGEYAVRGDILDIFPTGTQEPLRIDLFDDEIERIRTFDVMNQRSTGELKSYQFMVMSEVVLDDNTIKTFRSKYREAFGSSFAEDEIYEAVSAGRKYVGLENWLPFFYEDVLPTLFDYCPSAQIIYAHNVPEAADSKADSIVDYYHARLEALKIKSAATEEIYRPIAPELLYLTDKQLKEVFESKNAIAVTPLNIPASETVKDYKIIPGRNFSAAKNIALNKVYDDLKDYLAENKRLNRIVACFSEGSRERLLSTMNEYEIPNLVLADTWNEALKKAATHVVLTLMPLEHGFKGEGLCLISEQDILGEKQNRRKPKKASSKDFIADIGSLNVGDLVVHIDHGVGRFMGLENIVAGGAPHDCLKVMYANNAKLFVPVENIDVLSRYGLEDNNIELDTLGGSAWTAKKAKVKAKIRDIAEKLIKIAAERHLKKADNFVPPQGLFDDFCARFPYNETDDQLNAIADVMSDLNASIPMDRLVCGDVGFGKTEVAMRAAFAVAASGAQVAVIVPTTLLARQHYQNFKARLEGFPVKVKMLSRLVTPKESQETKQGLKDGSVEIVIGTHALLSEKIEFCNFGLLIIDEEQHFGVAHKEKLIQFKSDVHVLTLTATPIP
ncbi:MAG: DEAD/DEAH box helicase, partial [Alphaproteobacteria bacterium]|nr:DEAD/DEAH box helicase [Alphaproteobacteria bacterium]